MRKIITKSRGRQTGLSLIEILGALAVGAGLMALMIEIVRGIGVSQSALNLQRHHQMVVDAAAKYIEMNWSALLDQLPTSDVQLGVNMKTLQDQGLLPSWWRDSSSMGQSTCLLVNRKIASSESEGGEPRLQGLLITEGGRPIGLESIWRAAAVRGHGVGILDTDVASAGAVVPLGLHRQWGRGNFNMLGCGGKPLETGHLATWLTLRSPREIESLQAIMRRNANSQQLTILSGPLGFSNPADGHTLAMEEASTGSIVDVTENGACVSDAAMAATASGKFLGCVQVSSGAKQWKQLNPHPATLVNRISAPRVNALKTVVPDTSCADYSVGELAKVADGVLAYCYREKKESLPSSWLWKKVGGKWKYVSLDTMTRTAVFSNQAVYIENIPASARALQLQWFAEPREKELTISLNLPSGEKMPIVKTCCYRSANIPYLSGPLSQAITFSIDAEAEIAAQYMILSGYIDDDKTP